MFDFAIATLINNIKYEDDFDLNIIFQYYISGNKINYLGIDLI